MGVIRFCCWCDHEDNCEIKDPQKCGDKYSTLEEDATDASSSNERDCGHCNFSHISEGYCTIGGC